MILLFHDDNQKNSLVYYHLLNHDILLFAKPDVSYYGGSEEKYIQVCEPLGAASVAGTSYAAPWIARKLSYLIDGSDLVLPLLLK